MCWFDLVINMWGLLATSHATTNDNENLANKQHFCLGLFTNLTDLLISVDSRLIVLCILILFCTLNITYLPLEKLYHWEHQMYLDQN